MYDYIALDDGSTWVFLACEKNAAPHCHFYQVKGRDVSPISKSKDSLSTCVTNVQLTRHYVMLECGTTGTVTLYEVDAAYVKTKVYQVNGYSKLGESHAQLETFDEKLSTIYLRKDYAWAQG